MVESPYELTYVPALQTVHDVHAVALLTLLNVPDVQGAHWRSEVALPCVVTNSPGAQLPQETHALAALPS